MAESTGSRLKGAALLVAVAALSAGAGALASRDAAPPDHRSHVTAMYRINPKTTGLIASAATERCLRALLPADRQADGYVSPLLVAAYRNGVAHHASWRESTVASAFDRQAKAILVRDQRAYDASFETMTVRERADAMAIRHAIAAGADINRCVWTRVAAERWSVYLADPSGAGLRGAVSASNETDALAKLLTATLRD